MNSQEQSKAVDEAIYEAIHDYVEGQATTNLFMAAEKNVKKIPEEVSEKLERNIDQRHQAMSAQRRHASDDQDRSGAWGKAPINQASAF